MTEVCWQPIRIRNVRRSLIASTDNRVYLHRQNGLALPVRDVYDDFEAIKSRAAEWRRRQYPAVNRVMYSPAQPSRTSDWTSRTTLASVHGHLIWAAFGDPWPSGPNSSCATHRFAHQRRSRRLGSTVAPLLTTVSSRANVPVAKFHGALLHA